MNRAAAAVLYAQVLAGPDHPANLARFVFLDPHADWEGIAGAAVGSLRAEAGRSPSDRALVSLIEELSLHSEEFRGRWAAHDVRWYRSGVQPFHHPIADDLILNYNALELPSGPGQTMIVYTAEPDSLSGEALQLLASWTATPGHMTSIRSGEQH